MIQVKKFPVSTSFGDFKAKSEEFIIPFADKESEGFLGLDTGKVSKYGRIVFIGMAINVDHVFKKLVDSGQKINDVNATLSMLGRYLEELQKFKIGNVISITYSDDAEFKLIKEANRPPKNKEDEIRLP